MKWNYASVRAIDPAGLTDNGLPVGLQIVGPPLDTVSVITASMAYERANPWYDDYLGL